MIALAIAMLLQSTSAQLPPRRADCMGVRVPSSKGDIALISFAVGGTAEQLERIAVQAKKIGAIAQKPKKIDRGLIMFVFFESTVDWKAAVDLYNRTDNGEFHPGVPRDQIYIVRQTFSADVLKNCKS